jgi:Ca2+-binding RTX toxin-like protein
MTFTGSFPSLAVTAYGNGGNDTLTASSLTASHVALSGGDGDDRITGSAGNDTLSGGEGSDTISGGSGDDVLSGNAGNDIIYGNAGNDTLLPGSGIDILDGGIGVDTADYSDSLFAITASFAARMAQGDGTDIFTNLENITGSPYNDTLIGDQYNNTLSGGEGSDTISGLGGDDTIIWTGGIDTIDGGTGVNSLFVYGSEGNDEVTVSSAGDISLTSVQNLSFYLSSGDDTLILGATPGVASITAHLGEGNDLFDGRQATAPCTVYGEEGNDILLGGTGNDILLGGEGDDTVAGGTGSDDLDGSSGDDTLIRMQPTDALAQGEYVIDLLGLTLAQQNTWLDEFLSGISRPDPNKRISIKV